jgi:hypothetical protein
MGGSLISAGYPSLDKGMILIQPGVDFGNGSYNDFFREGVSVGVAAGFTDRFALSLKTGYVWSQTSALRKGLYDTSGTIIDTIKADTTLHFNNHGFGDGQVGVQYIVIPMTPVTKQELKAGIDVGIPWATAEKKTVVEGMNVVMPARSRTGSGSFTQGHFYHTPDRFRNKNWGFLRLPRDAAGSGIQTVTIRAMMSTFRFRSSRGRF